MASLTPDEAKKLRDMLKEIEKLSIKFKLNLDTTNLQDIQNNAEEIKNLFNILNDKWEDLTANASLASEAFRDTVKALSNQNIGLNTSVRVYKSFIPIADKILAYQKGSGELTIKDTNNFKKKIELRKIELKQSETSLQAEEKESQKKQDSLSRELAALKRKERENGKLNAYEKSERKRIEAALAREESHYQQIQNSIEQNNALLNDQDEAFKNLELSISEIARTLNQDLVKNLDKSFSNLINDVQTTEDGVKKVVKSFGIFENITQKIQDHQSGTNVLNEKDAKNLLNKAESERKRLANTQRLLQIEQKALEAKEKANQLDLNNLTARKEELKLASEEETITQEEIAELEELNKKELALLETRKDINSEITLNANLQKKIADIVEGQDENYQKLIQQIKAAKKEAENMRKALGLSGLAVDGIGKALGKVGLGGLASIMGLDEAKEKMKEVADEITEGGKKAAGLGGQFRILIAGLKEVGASILKNLTDPVVIVTGLVAGITAGIKGLISLFEETAKFNGDIAKTFGVSAAESTKIGDNLRIAASSDFFMNNEQARKAFDIMANASGTINSNFSDQKAVSAMNDLVTYAGRSVEAAEGLFRMGKLNNMEADDMEKSLRGQLTLLQKNNKLRINESQAIEMVAKSSATVRMNLSANPKKLADAAFYATKLGMSLDEIASAAEQTLNFESAIQNQLEYQVLTGKEINIDAYQQAAASGDTAKAAEEMNRILEEQGDSVKGNFFAQEALAKTLGISREQMMKSLEVQKVQKKVGGDVRDIEKAINKEMANGLSLEEASAKVGEKSYESIVKQNQNAQVFSNTISQIKEAFINTLASSDGFKQLFSKENIERYVNFITTTLIPKVEEFGRMAGKALEYLTDPKKLKELEDKFNKFKDTISEVAKIAATIGIVIGGLKLASGIKNLMGMQRGSSPGNPLFVRIAGGGGMPGADMFGSEGPGRSRNKIMRRVNQGLKVAGVAAGAYMAYNALSGKSEDEFSQEEVDAYRAQQPSVYSEEISTLEAKGNKRTQEETKRLAELKAQSDKEAREQLASQQYITGSRTGDIGLSAIDIASTSFIPTGEPSYSTKPTSTPGADLKSRAQQIAEMKSKTPGLTSEDALKQIRDSEKGWFTKLWDNITTGVKSIGTQLVDGAKGVWEGAKNIGKSLSEGTQKLVTQIGTEIGKFGSSVIEGAKNLALNAGKAISSMAGKAGDLIKNAITGITNTATKVLNLGKTPPSSPDISKTTSPDASTTKKSLFSRAMDWGSNMFSKGKKAVINVGTSIAENAQSLYKGASETITNLPGKIGKGVSSAGKYVATKAQDVYKGAKNLAKDAWKGVTNVADWVKNIFKTNIGQAIGKAFGPILDTVMGIANINSLISDAKSRKAAGEQVDTSQLGMQITKSGAYSIAKILLNFGGPIGTAFDLTDTALQFLGISPIQYVTDHLIDLFPDNAFKSLGDLALGEQSPTQQVQDGSLNPNGGPVVSTFQKGELVPVMQGIKEDNVYMTTNKPAQVEDGFFGKINQNYSNAPVMAAINKLTEVIISNSSKEITLAVNGQTVGKVLTPIMTPEVVREINNTVVLT